MRRKATVAGPLPLPRVLHREDGAVRRLGVEVEFIGVPLAEAGAVIADRIGGEARRETDYRVVGRGTAFGDFVRHPHTRASLKAHPYGVYVRLPGGAEHCGAFVRLERFAEDIVPVEAHLGFRVHLPGRVNASARARDWRHHYDESAAAAVAEACAEDIGRCGYRFDP